MPESRRQSEKFGYIVAVASVLLCVLLRMALDPIIGDRVPYATVFFAIAFTAWFGGFRAAMLALTLSILSCNYLFVPPRQSLALTNSGDAMATILFIFSGLIIAVLGGMAHRDRFRAEKNYREAQAERERLSVEMADRRAAERALMESEQKFRAVAESAATAIYIHDGKKLLFVNKAAEHITGYSREELYQINMWDIVHPEFKPMVMQRAAQRLKGLAPPDRYDYAIVAKNGQVKWLDFGAATITFEGKPCLLATAMDITERRLAQEALMSSEKLAATGRMAATIAHEINNPLEAVTNLLFLARSQPENAPQYLEMADEELRRVAHITKQTLGFYRDPTSPTKVAPSRLLEDVLSIYSKRMETKQIVVQSEFEEAAEVTVYSGEIRQVFSNLVSNAVDAMPAGGRLMLRVRRARRYADGHVGVIVTIADTGTGIAPETMKRIFEPFFTTKSDVGTGLGLWLTRGIVEKHRGSIRVRSRLDCGSVFQVFLPESSNDKLTTEAAA